jgi:hypothetical protein
MVAKRSKQKRAPDNAKRRGRPSGVPDYPRHSVSKSLRIPKAILDQNAGKACTPEESATFCGMGYHGPFQVEISSSVKFGFLDRPGSGTISVTELAKRALRPQSENDELEALRSAILKAPVIADVYKHYRGENLPDEPFFSNALTDTFKIPAEKRDEFRAIFLESLRDAKLIEQRGEKQRVLDIADSGEVSTAPGGTRPPATKSKANAGDSCFVMMPFASPIGEYFKSIYEPAIEKAGLLPLRADDDIFSTGKIMDQIWSRINNARVLVAELTGRNPNVFYELGLAHALHKPVVLVSSNQEDVPFDVLHIRVIYYDVKDPFWGQKLIAKVSENILSALENPSEAILHMPPKA